MTTYIILLEQNRTKPTVDYLSSPKQQTHSWQLACEYNRVFKSWGDIFLSTL